jgi:hypothetical protein
MQLPCQKFFCGLNRHCEERSDKAIHKQGRAWISDIFARNAIVVDCRVAKNKFWLLAMTASLNQQPKPY